MEFTTKELARLLKGTVDGNPDEKVTAFARIEHGRPGKLCFYANPKYERYVYGSKASAIIVNRDFVPKEPVQATLIRVDDAYTAVAYLLRYVREHESKFRHHRSLVSMIYPSAKLGRKVYVGSYSYIGRKCRIGDYTRIYQNVYNLNCFIDIPAGAKQLELTATKGDWVTIPEIGVTVGDKPEALLTLITNYGQKQNPITFADGKWSMAKEASLGRQWLWKEGVAPWIKLREQGVGIIVGEFGSYNKTPHDVVLAWLEDCLINWKEANMGWAMWNFRGSFGVLDSDRADVQYEDFNGHKLDRKMLDLLQKY